LAFQIVLLKLQKAGFFQFRFFNSIFSNVFGKSYTESLWDKYILTEYT